MIESSFALVAQLDRALGYEPRGQRFESSPVRINLDFATFWTRRPRNIRARWSYSKQEGVF